MAGDERWYFSKEEINNSPSRKCSIDAEKELTYRQQGAKLIQDMGQRLQVTQLVINTAIVYMHRFYMFHSFAKFHRHNIAPAALFLAAKVEEQPRKLEHVIKVAQYIICHHEHSNNLDAHTESYTEKAQELVMNENILLQTLGFDVAIDHPHTHVVKCFQMVRTPTELAQTSYLMATNSLHMTTMCLQYKPSVVACVCIYIICKWSNFEIQRFNEGKAWFCLVDPTVTLEMLEMLTSDFLTVLDKYPNRLKKIINAPQNNITNKDKDGNNDEVKSPTKHNSNSSLPLTIRPQSIGGGSRSHDANKSVTGLTKALAAQPSAANSKTVLSHKEYSEKREKERREREKERERQDQREKHPPLHPAPSASSSASSSYVPSITSTSTYSPLVPHLRSSEAGGRKMHADNNRQPTGHGSSNRGAALTGSAVFKDLNPKREVVSSRNERLDKVERTSENNVDSVKYVNEKLKSSVDYNRHSHSDWTQSRQLEYAKDRKLDIKMEVKPEVKFVPKDNRPLENREQKDFAPKVNENKIKTEPVWVKTEKVEPKEEVKVHEPVVRVKVQKNEPKEDLKHNSCIFNNNDFSLRDFLNPSEMPPEDIFDTGIDYKSNASESSYYSAETTHHKLKSPPKSGSSAQVATTAPQPVSSSTSLKGTNSSNSNANNKQGLETHHASAEAKNTKHSNLNPASTNIYTHGSQSLDKNLGNGLPATTNLVASGASNLPSSSSRRKEKIRSPLSLPSHQQALKAKHQTLNPEHVSLVSHVKSDNHKPLPTKESAPANSQDVPPKDSQPSVVPRGRSAGPSATLEKAGSLSQTPHSFTPIKTSSIVEAPKADTVVNVRLSHPEACEVNVGAFTMPAPVAPNPSSAALPSPLKKHKYEHGHHKHKEKKKHKHKDKDKEEKKEKDKHKEKESKEHKKGRKHKKHKDKDKEKKKEEKKKEEMLQQQHQQQLMQQSQTPAKEDGNATGPLKITIHRTKGIYTPDVPTGTARVQSGTPVVERESASGSSLDTPGRIKLTIPKYRLQGNSSSQGSPPKEPPSNPPKEMGTPKVKLKITKDHLKLDRGERDSRKRERAKSPSDSLQPSKLSRSSSSYNAPQVLDSTRWSSQRH